jgi:beta-galactosidase beta subunit
MTDEPDPRVVERGDARSRPVRRAVVHDHYLDVRVLLAEG